jgi:hypothetical protein
MTKNQGSRLPRRGAVRSLDLSPRASLLLTRAPALDLRFWLRWLIWGPSTGS